MGSFLASLSSAGILGDYSFFDFSFGSLSFNWLELSSLVFFLFVVWFVARFVRFLYLRVMGRGSIHNKHGEGGY